MLAATEDVYITPYGKVVAKLSNPFQDRVDVAKSLFGILPADKDEPVRPEHLPVDFYITLGQISLNL